MGFFGLGELPKEYNRKIHGPYDPAVYYGKSNTNWLSSLAHSWQFTVKWFIECLTSFFSEDPIGSIKVTQIPSWLLRRRYDPGSIARACSRTYWAWAHKYAFPRKAGLTPYIQVKLIGQYSLFIINSDSWFYNWAIYLILLVECHDLCILLRHQLQNDQTSQEPQVPLVKHLITSLVVDCKWTITTSVINGIALFRLVFQKKATNKGKMWPCLYWLSRTGDKS